MRNESGKLVIGTRGSKLALWQAEHVKATIEEKFPEWTAEIFIIKTKGDKIQDVPLAKVGGKGLFVKEIEEALLDGRIDIAVHSMKDMPAEIPEGLCIGAVPAREMPSDVLISRDGCEFSQLKKAAKIGTSSLRRGAQLKHARPDVEIVPLRGNLDTRLRKLEDEDLDAIVLAAAGVKRLGLETRITQYLDDSVMLPAVGQGALCIEIRKGDPVVGPVIEALDDKSTHTVVVGERAFLHRLEGGCQVPIAAHGRLDGESLELTGLVADLDGSTIIKDTVSGPAENAKELGTRLAERILEKGAGPILEKLKQEILK